MCILLSVAVKCEEDSIRCANGLTCYAKMWRCDNQFDCADESDEQDCDNNGEKHKVNFVA